MISCILNAINPIVTSLCKLIHHLSSDSEQTETLIPGFFVHRFQIFWHSIESSVALPVSYES